MPVFLEDVDHIALLARLGLTDDERTEMRSQLDAILGYVEQLATVDTSAVDPTANIVDTPAPVREDHAVNEARAEKMVEGAPDRDGTYLRVPKILE